MSKTAKLVIAFEPSEVTRNILLDTLTINNCVNVKVDERIVSDKLGKSIFYESDVPASNANSIAVRGTPIIKKAVTIDALNIKIDFIKMDIEGSEILALRGAKKTLMTLKYLTIEIHPSIIAELGLDVREIFDLLRPYRPEYYFNGFLTDEKNLLEIKDHFELNIILGENLPKKPEIENRTS